MMTAVLANTPEAQCGKKHMKDLNPVGDSKVSKRDNHVIFHLDSYSETEIKELRDKFTSELQCIRNLINSIESGTIGQKRTMPVTSDDTTETKRRKCTPNKETTAAMMRECSFILAKLMKHKHAWVFNEPVDVVALGLRDYYQLIKRPMDLGTIKRKLAGKRGYGTPIDFAMDVRLTFHNAMFYNRQGEDVHTMATELLHMFDELFNPVYEKYKVECQPVIVEQRKLSKPLAENMKSQVVSSQKDTKKPPQVHSQAALPKKLCKEAAENSVSKTKKTVPEKPLQIHSQAALPKKLCKEAAKKSVSRTKKTVPEVKENPPSRKEMSDCERDKLGLVLQDLAEVYWNEILQILAKRNPKMATPGEDSEIELDVHALDSETVWDLHKFAKLHLKADQKRTKKEEITSQSTITLENNKFTHEPAMPTTPKIDEDIDIGDEMPVNDYPPVVIERDHSPCPASNVRPSNSSSSSSGTDSSSDSDSSSGSDSEISDAA